MRERLSFENGNVFLWPVCQIQSADFNFQHVSVHGFRSALRFVPGCSVDETELPESQHHLYVFDGACLPSQLEIASALAESARAVLFTDRPSPEQLDAVKERLANATRSATLEDGAATASFGYPVLPRAFLPPILYLPRPCAPLEILRDQARVNSQLRTPEMAPRSPPLSVGDWLRRATLWDQLPPPLLSAGRLRNRVSLEAANTNQWIYEGGVGEVLALTTVFALAFFMAYDVFMSWCVTDRLREEEVRRRMENPQLYPREEVARAWDVSNRQSRKHFVLVPIIASGAVGSVLCWICGSDHDSILTPLLMMFMLVAQFFSYLLIATLSHYVACGLNVTVVTDQPEREVSRMHSAMILGSVACLGATCTNPLVGIAVLWHATLLAEIVRRNLKFVHLKKECVKHSPPLITDPILTETDRIELGDSQEKLSELVNKGISKAVLCFRLALLLDIFSAGAHVYAHCFLGNDPISPCLIFATNVVNIIGKVLLEHHCAVAPRVIFLINYKFHESEHRSKKLHRAECTSPGAVTDLTSKHSNYTVLFVSPEADRPFPIHGLSPAAPESCSKVDYKLCFRNWMKNVCFNVGPLNSKWFESGLTDALRVRRASSVGGALDEHHTRIQILLHGRRILHQNQSDGRTAAHRRALREAGSRIGGLQNLWLPPHSRASVLDMPTPSTAGTTDYGPLNGIPLSPMILDVGGDQPLLTGTQESNQWSTEEEEE